jgi:hypothetical protein
MGLMVPNAAQGHDLDQIFVHKLPKIRKTEDKYLIGAEIIAYCKWLIYTAPFKDVNNESHMQINQDFYHNKCGTIRIYEGSFRRRLKEQLKIWYDKHQPSKRQRLPSSIHRKIQTMNWLSQTLHGAA